MKKITKEQKYMVSIFFVIITSVILFLYPEIVKYPYSFTSIEEKKSSIEQANSQLISNETSIKQLAKEKETKELEENNVNNEALRLKRNINSDDFKLDIPSLLISLEQKANEKSLKLNIHYDKIQTVKDAGSETGGQGEAAGSKEQAAKSGANTDNKEKAAGSTDGANAQTDSNKQSTENKTAQETVKDANGTTTTEQTKTGDSANTEKTVGGQPVENKENDDKASKSGEFTDEDLKKGLLTINGLDTTIVPIVVIGSYSEVRSYIKYLDELGLIEPSFVELESKEKKVTAKIVLNIFNGEVLQ